jgi:hypothetical protein
VLVCPSDSGLSSPAVAQKAGTSNYYGMTSYRFNHSALRYYSGDIGSDGVFLLPDYGSVQILAITDGTSSTILFGESSNFDPNWPQWSSCWFTFENQPLERSDEMTEMACFLAYPLILSERS